METSLSRYPKRLGLSIGDQMVENGDKWRIGPSRLCGSHSAIYPTRGLVRHKSGDERDGDEPDGDERDGDERDGANERYGANERDGDERDGDEREVE